MAKTDGKSSGIFIRVTDDFNKSIDKIITKSSVVSDLIAKGYDVDKSVIGRFGYLLICQNLELLAKNPELLLAASKSVASEELLVNIAKEMKK